MKNNTIINKIIFVLLILLTIFVISNISYAGETLSNEYKIITDNNTKYIIGIYPNTRAKEIKNNIKTQESIIIYNNNKQILSEEGIVKTGYEVQIGKTTYITIVCGDTNGDGNVSVTDLAKVKRHLVGTEVLVDSGGIAVDVDGNGKVTSTDVLKLKRLLVRIIETRDIFEEKYDNNQYAYIKNTLTNKIKITAITDENASGTLQIPGKIDGNDVKAIQGSLGKNGNITKIVIPTEIEEISKTSFCGLTNLNEIEVSELNENYSSKDGILYNKTNDILVFCPRAKNNKELVIENGVTEIGEYAFYKNETIERLYIPDTVTKLEKNSFEEMEGKIHVKEGQKLIDILEQKEIEYEVDFKVKVSSVSLDKVSETIYLNSKEVAPGSMVSIIPENAENKNVTWESSDPSVATVDSYGTITTKNVGMANIIVKTEDGGKTATLKLTVKKKVIIVIGASQVTRMNDYAKTYDSEGNYRINYSVSNGTLNYIFKSGSDITYQTGEGWELAHEIINACASAKKYVDFHIFFPLVGNSIQKFACSEITDSNTTITGYVEDYNDLIVSLKNEGYNVQGYVISMHPINPSQATSAYAVENEDSNACKPNYRSNLKYYTFNKVVKALIDSKYTSNLKYEELFTDIMEVNEEGKNYTFKIVYNTTDGVHWDEDTTINYVKMMLDYSGDL